MDRISYGKVEIFKEKEFQSFRYFFFFFLLVEVDEKRIPIAIVIRVNHLGADSLFEWFFYRFSSEVAIDFWFGKK